MSMCVYVYVYLRTDDAAGEKTSETSFGLRIYMCVCARMCVCTCGLAGRSGCVDRQLVE